MLSHVCFNKYFFHFSSLVWLCLLADALQQALQELESRRVSANNNLLVYLSCHHAYFCSSHLMSWFICDVERSPAEDVGFEFVVFNATRVVDVDHLEEWVDVLALNGDFKFGDEVRHFINSQVSTLIQIEVVKDLAKECLILAGKFENASFDFAEEVRDSLLGDLGVLFFRNLPDTLHHADKVFV